MRPARAGAPREMPARARPARTGAEVTFRSHGYAIAQRVLPFARRHATWLRRGTAAALGVVAARLALPWPLRAIVDGVVAGDVRGVDALLKSALPMAALFLGVFLALGLFDFLERLCFARFSIATVRDFRNASYGAALRLRQRGVKSAAGDLIARLVGDSARIKAGMQGFLVHVLTNALVFLGVTCMLLWIQPVLGAILGLALVTLAGVTVVGASELFYRSVKSRTKEGRLADQILRDFRRPGKIRDFKRLSRSSGRHEAAQTRAQGLTTWGAHAIMGIATLAALAAAARSLAAGSLSAGDLVVVAVYLLMLGPPTVRLARQGSRTGKILGPTYRLLQILDAAEAEAPSRALRPGLPRRTPHAEKGAQMKILFTGYAPVHFVCFQPLFDRLRELPGVEVFVSGGLRQRAPGQPWTYDTPALYDRFALPEGHVLTVEQIRRRDFDVILGANTKLILPRSVRTRIQIFHGVSFRNKAVRPDNMACDHYFLVGPYMRRKFAEAGLLAADDPRSVSIGFMKTDRMARGDLEREPLLRSLGLADDRPVVLYAPTGAKHNSLEIMGERVIEELLAADRYNLIVKPHDHPKNVGVDWLERLAPFEGPHCRLARGADVTALLFLADLLISDASSVANEYTLMDRPIVFLDTPKLIRAARTAEHSMLDLDTWGRRAGVVVKRPSDVPDAIAESLARPEALHDVRQAMADDLFYHPGHATDAALRWLEENLGIGAPRVPVTSEASDDRTGRQLPS